MNARAWVWLGLSIAVLGCEATVGASGGGGGATGGGSAGGGASGGGSAVELDSGAPDAGAPDAGAPDSGTPDAGAIDAGAIVSRTFTPLAATVDVPNPERGFYKWFTSDVLSAFDAAQLATLRGQGFRLVHFPVNLSGFRTQNLSTAVLSTLGLRFGELRAQRLKAVVLFSYNFDASGVDATSSQIAAHLAQLKPVLEANADVIAFTRAGFIGAWGEWHSSTNQNSCGYMAGGTPCSVADANRLVVRDALLSGYAPSTSVGFRYPGDVIKWFPTVLDGGTSQQARVAFHNDCFLAGPTDTGTYASATSADRAYVASATEFVPFGGETCDAEQPLRTACADILAEGARYHLAWLNFDYHPSFVTAWTNRRLLRSREGEHRLPPAAGRRSPPRRRAERRAADGLHLAAERRLVARAFGAGAGGGALGPRDGGGGRQPVAPHVAFAGHSEQHPERDAHRAHLGARRALPGLAPRARCLRVVARGARVRAAVRERRRLRPDLEPGRLPPVDRHLRRRAVSVHVAAGSGV